MRRILLLILIAIILAGCKPEIRKVGNQQLTEQKTTTRDLVFNGQPTITAEASQSISSNGLDIYFTDPTNLVQGDYSGGADEYLVQAIGAAKISIDMAIYSINLWSIRDALIKSYQHGVQVRIVMESDNIDDDVPRALISAGIRILGDRHEGLMHNKFVIIDGQDVWTGSANMTIGSFYYDNNNLVHLHSVDIAEDYLTEFEEMYMRDMFGSDVVAETPHPQVMVGSSLVEVYFSPDDRVAEPLLKIINNAQESITFMAYSFTANDLGSVIVDRVKAGISVEGVMDDGQIISNIGTEYDSFIQAGIKVYRAANEGLMHHKVIIIDRTIVITGSYNFSKNAENTNDENIVIIHNQDIAEKYLEEYERIISNLKK